MTPDCYYHPSGTKAVKHSHVFSTPRLFREKKYSKLDGADRSIWKVRRIGAAAENKTYITMDYLSGCFLSPPFRAPCTSRWMFIIISPPLSSGWSCPFFRGSSHHQPVIDQTLQRAGGSLSCVCNNCHYYRQNDRALRYAWLRCVSLWQR